MGSVTRKGIPETIREEFYRKRKEISLKKNFSEDELAVIEILSDPVRWAESHLKNPKNPAESLTLRDFQKKMLRDKSKKRVARIGRRCLVGTTPILLADGKWKNIKDIQIGDKVVAYNKLSICSQNVTAIFDNGMQDVYEIKLSNGRILKCTSNHPIMALTKTGKTPYSVAKCWSTIDTGLTVGTRVLVIKNYKVLDILKLKSRGYRNGYDSFRWVRIKSITHIGKEQTYDITVDNTHNFIANGIVVHNSGKTIVMCADMLYHAFTESNKEILIAAPYEDHIRTVWKSLNQLIRDSHELNASIKKIKYSPYEIIFNNGSIISGKTAGSKSGQKGTGIRGSSADYLYLDEADFLGEDAMVAIMAILQTTKETKVWASSTPSGRRDYFYRWCRESAKLGWTEFHYPSSVSPEWISIEQAKRMGLPLHESSEYYYRNDMAEDDYLREYMAEFGEESVSVFKNTHIDACVYGVSQDVDTSNALVFDPGYDFDPNNSYIMGVDWNNEKNGIHIVIMELIKKETIHKHWEYNKDQGVIEEKSLIMQPGTYRLMYRCGISAKDITQKAGREKIIEINNKFKLDYIYVDRGHGETNIEELREYGKNNPASGMLNKLRWIDFSSVITTRDPVNGTEVKKFAKQFLVSNGVLQVERHCCIFPDCEDESVRLIGQMRAFSVKSFTQSGRTVYSETNDHILMAWLIAMFGFQNEYSSLIKHEWNQNIRISTNNILTSRISPPSRWDTDNRKRPITMSPKPMLGADSFTLDPKSAWDGHIDEGNKKKLQHKPVTPWNFNFGAGGSWGKLGRPKRTNF